MKKQIVDRIMALGALAGDSVLRRAILTDYDEAAIGRLVESAIYTVGRSSGLAVSALPDGDVELTNASGTPLDPMTRADIEDAVTDMVAAALGLDSAAGVPPWVCSGALPKIKPHNI